MCNYVYSLLVRNMDSDQRDEFNSVLNEPVDGRSQAAARQLLVELGGV